MKHKTKEYTLEDLKWDDKELTPLKIYTLEDLNPHPLINFLNLL